VFIYQPVTRREKGQLASVTETANPFAGILDRGSVGSGQEERKLLWMFGAQLPYIGLDLKRFPLYTGVLDPIALQQFAGRRIPLPREAVA
jgi:hypothetical protein